MPYSLKAISISFWGGGPIFEGLRKLTFVALFSFCQSFMGANPQRLGHGGVQWNSFWDIAFREQAIPDTEQNELRWLGNT